jgi:hypothetical protein
MDVSGQLHCPGRFTSEERTFDTHCIRGWVGPRDSVNALEERKFLFPLPGIEP